MGKESGYEYRLPITAEIDSLHMLESGARRLVTIDLQIDLPLDVYTPANAKRPVFTIHRP